VVIGATAFSIKAGGSRGAAFALTTLGRLLLTDHRHLPISVAISGGPEGSASTIATRPLTLSGTGARERVAAIHVASDGTITVRVALSTTGTVDVLVRAWNYKILASAAAPHTSGRPRPTADPFVVARASASSSRPATVTVTIRPGARGRRLIADPATTLRLSVTYIPIYARELKTGIYWFH
jgi:hypothetical protein